MAIASLVLGIVATVFGIIFGGFGWIGILCGIVGIVLGALSKKNKPEGNGMATAGLVLSIIGTILSAIVFIACVACASSMGAAGMLF